jgi:hypothetical protein
MWSAFSSASAAYHQLAAVYSHVADQLRLSGYGHHRLFELLIGGVGDSDHPASFPR